MRRFDFNGSGEMVLVDKPRDWTSFDVVRKVRNLFHVKKIGHAGTLDPQATGLLILCTGPRTKDLNEFLGYDKTYTGAFRIGIETPSYDLETEISERRSWEHVDENLLRETVAGFTGQLSQLPPMYSALKHKGKALYKYARAGRSVTMTPRDIVVHEFGLTSIGLPDASFKVRCSKGTYIRSLVHDIGSALGTGAVLTELRRESVGPWRIDDAYTIDDLIRLREHEESHKALSHGPSVHS